MATREEQRREHNEQKELESLRRVFESLDKSKQGKIGFKELNDQLIKLDYRAKRVEVEDMIWEVDEDCDHCVSWDEFKLMFHRCRNDKVRARARVTPASESHRRRGCASRRRLQLSRRVWRATRAHGVACMRRRGWSRASYSTWWSS